MNTNIFIEFWMEKFKAMPFFKIHWIYCWNGNDDHVMMIFIVYDSMLHEEKNNNILSCLKWGRQQGLPFNLGALILFPPK